MKVGLVIYGSLSGRSGGYRYDRELVRRLEARGSTVKIFAQRWRAYSMRLTDNVNRRWQRRIRESKLDLLLEDELNHPSLLTMAEQPDLPPRVSIVHHLRASERHPRVAMAVYRAVERRYLDGVDAFVCNSETTAAAVRALSPRARPLIVAKPAGRESVSSPTREQVVARASSSPLRVLFVGQLTARKGLHVLLDALARLQRRTWHLDVVGDMQADPRYAQRCERRAEALPRGAVQFHGYLHGPALDATCREAHVLCVPSQYEGYGIVYAEAFQYGLPVVATLGGAAQEIVQHAKNGFLVPVESVSAVAAALTALCDPSRLRTMSLSALERARELPTWTQSMDAVVDFLHTIPSKARRG